MARLQSPSVNSVIKSIQRGATSIPNTGGVDSVTITISPVNLNKSIIKYLGSYSSDNNNPQMLCRVEFVDSTTIRVKRGSTNLYTSWCGWEVVEYA